MAQPDIEQPETTAKQSATSPCQPDAVTPGNQIIDMCYINLIKERVLYTLTKLGIPDLLHNASLKSEELAKATNTHPRTLYRLLRAASCAGLLNESSEHAFSLTPLGDLLRSDVPGSMRGFVIFVGDPYYMNCWVELPYCIRSGEQSWEKVLGLSQFEYFRQNPEIGAIFDECMTGWSNNEAVAVIKAFDFSGYDTIVDVGGGHGILLTHILKASPNVRGVLFDQDHVIAGSRSRIEKEGLLSRCGLVSGDFFSSVPTGGDAYILKSILHDWPDEKSLAILKTCRRAMGNKGQLLVLETIVPPPGEEHFSKYMDMEMLVLLGGQERTLEEFEALFAQAGFRLTKVVPTEEFHSIIVAVPV